MTRFTHTSWLAGLIVTSLIATAATPPSPSQEEVVQLSAFQVQSTKDPGYRTTNSQSATRTATAILDTPLNVTVLNAEFIADIDSQNLNDALDYVSNVSTTTLGNNGRQGGSNDAARIRGFEVSGYLRNGYRRDRNLTVRNIERVEVVKGPVGQLFGQTTPGGMINYITKRPDFRRQTELRATVGTYNHYGFDVDYQDHATMFGAKKSNAAWRVLYGYEDQDFYRDFEFQTDQYVAGQFAIRPLAGLSIMVEHEYMDRKSCLAQGLPRTSSQWHKDWAEAVAAGRTADATRWFSSVGNWANDIQARTGKRPIMYDSISEITYPAGQLRTYNLGGPDMRFNNRSNSSSLEADWRVSDRVSVRYGANRYDVHFYENVNGVDFINADGSVPINGNLFSRNNDRVITTQQLDAVWQFEAGRTKHSLLAGAETLNDYTTNRRLAYDAVQMLQQQGITRATPAPLQPDRGPVQNAAFYYAPRTMPITLLNLAITTFDRPQNKSLTEIDRLGYYVAYRATLFSDRLTAMGSVRREEVDTNAFTPFNGIRTVRTDKGTTYSAGLNFKLATGFAAFAGYSESFEPTSSVTATGPLARPDEVKLIGPVEGSGYEAGVKMEVFEGRLSGTVGLFKVERTNIVARDLQRTQNDPRNFDPRFANNLAFPFNVDFAVGGAAETVEGVDADFVWSPNRNWQFLLSGAYIPTAETSNYTALDPGFGLLANGTQARLSPISNDGLRLTRTPRWSHSIWSKYRFTQGPLTGLSLGLGTQYKGRSQIFGGTSADNAAFVAPAYWLFDAVATYETKLMGRRTVLTLSVKNLTDKVYFAGNYTYGEPLRAQLSARFSF
jgi:iron complex outermembrane receptor protein